MPGKAISPGSHLAPTDSQGRMLFIALRPPDTTPWGEGRVPCDFRVRVLVCAPYVVSTDTVKDEGDPEDKQDP